MLVEITKAQLVSRHLGRMLDEHRAAPAQISLAKLNNVREAIKIARMARDILGARGILADHHIIRHLCDLEAISTLEGTAGMHTLVLGQEITGISAFRGQRTDDRGQMTEDRWLITEIGSTVLLE